MKLEEWKKFFNSIPDSDHTRKSNYMQFEEAKTVDGEEEDAMDCYILLNGKHISALYANADRGFAMVVKGYNSGDIMMDENGDVETEFLFGDIKIIKYKHKY